MAKQTNAQPADICKLCGSVLEDWLHMPIDPIRNMPTPFANALRCTSCGAGSIRPVPSAADFEEFYKLETYYTHGIGHIGENVPNAIDRLLARLAWAADHSVVFDIDAAVKWLQPGARVVDLGCGHPRLLRELQAAGFHVTAVAPDPVARAHAEASGLTVLAGACDLLPAALQPGMADLVVMPQALAHCRDPDQAIRNAWLLLKPGGTLYTLVPNCAAVHFRTFNVTAHDFDAPRHLQFFTPDSLFQAVESRGFTIEHRIFNGYIRQFQPSLRNWEATIWDRAKNWHTDIKAPRNSVANAWKLLLRTAFAAPEIKYDCVGVLARKAV